MKLLLKDFQSQRVAELVRQLRHAAREARGHDAQAVALSAPTGSGKTVMATAAIELLLQGDDASPPDPDVTFLWITDQPDLNEQTRRKMLAASSVLGTSDLIVVDAAFDRESFAPGVVYFLNTQKLSRTAVLVSPGDRRTYTIWQTISNTVAQRPGKFFVFIDEAHRGMTEGTRARNEATTIIQKFIKGSPGEIPAIPLVVGISATPQRFIRLLEGQARTLRSVAVTPPEVRESGLLKERITLYHPTETQPSDMTMLGAAARAWRTFVQEWTDYCDNQSEATVRPVLVIQVQDGARGQLSRTDIASAITAIDVAVGPIPPEAFAHAFQESTSVSIGGRQLRYIQPSDIDADPDVQVIFFKTSLNTGWDCPRAEVMMSFRTANDATLIAQLVGRMVRTPLARRVDVNEHLNNVSLFLPHYDESGLTRVVGQLTVPDPDILPPVPVEKGEDALTLQRATFADDVFDALERLPSYVIPRSRKTSQVRRLMKLGRLLANDDIDPDGPEKATAHVIGVLRSEYDRLKDSDQFRAIVHEKGRLEVRGINWRLYGTLDDDAETMELDIASENLDDLFDSAGRKLGDGLHKAWWKARLDEGDTDSATAKLELFALSTDRAVLDTADAEAQRVVQDWMSAHFRTIGTLSEGRQQEYREVVRQAAKPELTSRRYPLSIDGTKADALWKRHVYVEGNGFFPAKLNRWETRVVEQELQRSDVVAWLRNPDRKDWSLCVPYQDGGEWKPLYPDFLIVRESDGALVIDLLDPHAISLADAPAKAAGLAQYAADHPYEFGRIDLMIVDGDDVRRLNLAREEIRDQVKGITTHQELRRLFAHAAE